VYLILTGPSSCPALCSFPSFISRACVFHFSEFYFLEINCNGSHHLQLGKVLHGHRDHPLCLISPLQFATLCVYEDADFDDGTYKLVFDMEAYEQGTQDPFFPEIDVVFKVDGDGAHYHVSVVVSPYVTGSIKTLLYPSRSSPLRHSIGRKTDRARRIS